MDKDYSDNLGYDLKPKNVYSNIPVPWQLKVIAFFIFFESLFFFLMLFFGMPDSMEEMSDFIFVFFVGILTFVFMIFLSYSLKKGVKWAREFVMYSSGLAFASLLVRAVEFYFISDKGKISFLCI